MAKIVKSLLTFLKRGPERRRIQRIPCSVTAHFFIFKGETQYRGSATVSDITMEGLCLSNVNYYYTDIEIRLKINTPLNIYFALPRGDGSNFNFELVGKIRSITEKDRMGNARRFGMLISTMSRKEKKMFRECVNHLKKQQPSE